MKQNKVLHIRVSICVPLEDDVSDLLEQIELDLQDYHIIDFVMIYSSESDSNLSVTPNVNNYII